MKNRNILNLTFLFTLLASFACSESSQSDTKTDSDQNTFRMAVVFATSTATNPWSKTGYNALKHVESTLNVQTTYIDNVPQEKAEAIIRKYAQEKQLIMAHSDIFLDALVKVADEFPDTKFLTSSLHPGNNRNLASIGFRDFELGYLLGATAALKSKTKHIAFISGPESPLTRDMATAYSAGAKHLKQDIKVSTTFLSTWFASEEGAEFANKMIKENHDVIGVWAGRVNQVVIKIAQEKGIHAIGFYMDQNSLAPETVLTSGVQNFNKLLLKSTKLAMEGRLEGKRYQFGLRDGVQDIAPFHDLLTPEEGQVILDLKKDIIEGKVNPLSP